MTAAQLMGLLFLGRNVAHSVHFNTRSYSKHVALNIFYDRIIGVADDFAEAYQGRHGLIGPIAIPAAKKTTNIIEFLQAQLDEIEKGRYKVCDKDDSSLQQLIDNIVEVYLRTLYKLRFLA
jgi:hypothetical protein